MPIIILEKPKSTFVSTLDECKNFSSFDYLTIGNKSAIKSNTLLKFDLRFLDNSNITVNRAILILPITAIDFDKYNSNSGVTVSYNTEDFKFSRVTWNTKPNTEFIRNTTITCKALKKRALTANVTDIVSDWIAKDVPNFGFTLSSITDKFLLILSKCNPNCGPKLLIDYCQGPTS